MTTNEDVENVLRYLQQPKVALRVAALVVDTLDANPAIAQLPRETYSEVSNTGALFYGMGYLDAMGDRDMPSDPIPLDDEEIEKPELVAFAVTATTEDGTVGINGQVMGTGSFSGLIKKIFLEIGQTLMTEHPGPTRIIAFSVIRGLPVQMPKNGETK